MQTLKKLLSLLNSKERKDAVFLTFMIVIMALLDMIGVASILPFMTVLTNPDIIETNTLLNQMYQISLKFGVENNTDFLFILGVIVFLLLVTSLFFKGFTTYLQLRFAQLREYSIGKRFIEGYLNQPYSWFLNRNSSDIGKTILSEVSIVVGKGMKPLMDLISGSLVAIALIILLVITDPQLALMVGFLLSATYGLIFKISSSYLKRIGKERLKSNNLRFLAVSEAFGAAKQLKISGLEKVFAKRFSDPAKKYAIYKASAAVIAHLPRFALEGLAFGSIMLIILYLMTKNVAVITALPIISLYVFAGYRLIPALQQIYASLSKFAFVAPSLDSLCKDIKNLQPSYIDANDEILNLNKTIKLKNINFFYPNGSRKILKEINMNISAKTTVGLIGATGSGKTTIIDIILGLLEAQSGTLEVDHTVITKQNLRSWQRTIGYVPQHIYLSDTCITSNIAYGIDHKNVNHDAVEKAAKIANLHDFVINELPDQYRTKVGERGIRLSGGQLQRIGIARALYSNPQVLIFDEATSALDNETEKAVMDAVNNIKKNITIIIIAHRLNTVKNCDYIYKLENGKIKDQGTFPDFFS